MMHGLSFTLPRQHRRRRGVKLCVLAQLMLLLCLPFDTGHADAAADQALERRVKAAFLYRFTEYITWPETVFPNTRPAFVVAVIGDEALAAELQQITFGRSVQGRPVEVRRLGTGDKPGSEHLVFIGTHEKKRLQQLIQAAPPHAVVVTESEGALTLGSIINFVIADGRVRFEISLKAAERRSLRLSSRLLAVARTVYPETP